MKKKTKGNQKHLTLSQRVEIEKGLLSGDSFSAISKRLEKDPSTVSKEIRRHSKVKERKNVDFSPIPCSNRKGCKIKYLCGDPCETICTLCPDPKIKCIHLCPNYVPKTCSKLAKHPMFAMAVENASTA